MEERNVEKLKEDLLMVAPFLIAVAMRLVARAVLAWV